MKAIVAIHNSVNEKAWQQILLWEKLNDPECQPKLVRFMGRPQDISPKARFFHWMGYQLPFDRHDWFVERHGTQFRYVIDFYNGSVEAGGRPLSMYIDARPALDSFPALWLRTKKAFNPFFPLEWKKWWTPAAGDGN